jgi:hypothetical protein
MVPQVCAPGVPAPGGGGRRGRHAGWGAGLAGWRLAAGGRAGGAAHGHLWHLCVGGRGPGLVCGASSGTQDWRCLCRPGRLHPPPPPPPPSPSPSPSPSPTHLPNPPPTPAPAPPAGGRQRRAVPGPDGRRRGRALHLRRPPRRGTARAWRRAAQQGSERGLCKHLFVRHERGRGITGAGARAAGPAGLPGSWAASALGGPGSGQAPGAQL